MKLSTKVDVIEARTKIFDKKKELVNKMTELLVKLNNSHDEKLKKELNDLEVEDKTLSWVLEEILIEKEES